MNQDEEISITLGTKRGRIVKKFSTPEMLSTMERIDKIIDDVRYFTVLKDDVKTTVGRVNVRKAGPPFDILVKRFNYSGIFRFYANKLTGSRAQRFYKNALCFMRMGLNVPEAIAFLEADRLKNTYYFSRYVDRSENLGSLCKQGSVIEPEKISKLIGEAIARWHVAGAVHGDLKWSNILLTEDNECVFIDLDQSKYCPSSNIRGIKRDLKRFYRYALDLNVAESMSNEIFAVYYEKIPADMKKKIDFTLIKEEAAYEWMKKKHRIQKDSLKT
jgi:tRNA A-37 threonylcarbamoyl transferase component Bud32